MGHRRHKSFPLHERTEVIQLISKSAEHFTQIESAPLDGLLKRIGKARIVLLGESTHGTSEFYQMRRRITEELIIKKGFDTIAIEADWPDVEQLNRFIRHLPHGLIEKKTFTRFPSWMWKNEEFHSFILWLRHFNAKLDRSQSPVNLYGLDLYNFYQSIETILSYLDQKDPKQAQTARENYGCLLAWGKDLTIYGRATTFGFAKECEDEVISVLIKLLEDYANERLAVGEEEFISLFQNALSVAHAEEYYRALYRSGEASWNVRDRHMFETLETLLSQQGGSPKVVIWAHNSHIGNAAATESSELGEFNLGQLCKEKYGEEAYLIGFGTHKGTVAAASSWGGAMEVKEIRASHPESVERLFHDTGSPSFILSLKDEVKNALAVPLLHRAIGVVYLPENELRSHYLDTVISNQFDGYIWFDHTHAVLPLSAKSPSLPADLYPFGL